MSIVCFVMRPIRPIIGVFDCSEVLEVVRGRLAADFKDQELGAAVGLDVPGQFRGPLATLVSVEQERDYEQFKSVRRSADAESRAPE